MAAIGCHQLAQRDRTSVAELAGPGPIRVVHFWDPACPCNVGNQQHLGELIEYGETSQIFTNPRETRTKDYITGRYG